MSFSDLHQLTIVELTPDELEKAYGDLVQKLPAAEYDRRNEHKTVHEVLMTGDGYEIFLGLLQKCHELLSITQDTGSEHTLFIPMDDCWKEHDSATKEEIKELLSMHISPHYVTTEGLLHMPNVPTILHPPHSNGPQIIRTRVSNRGWQLNNASRVVRQNIVCSNGVIHNIDQILVPPLDSLDVLGRNGLRVFGEAIKTSGMRSALASSTKGCTIFAPADAAFEKLGKDITEFLFNSGDGLPYLRALVQLHVVPDLTVFSNFIWPKNNTGARQTSRDAWKTLKGRIMVHVPTMLQEKGEPIKLAVIIVRFNGLISMYVNDRASVVGQDIATSDGVVHAVDEVILPGAQDGTSGHAELTLEQFKGLLSPFIHT